MADQNTPVDLSAHRAPCPHCAGEQARIYRPDAPEGRVEITSPEAAADLLMPMLADLDHLVIGHQRWTSLARHGVLIEQPSPARTESVPVQRR